MVTEPTRITQTTVTLIDHVCTTHPENIGQCFTSSLALSDHFPVCFSRKINSNIPKDKHITISYSCFKQFDENRFISDVSNDLNSFVADKSCIDDDFAIWYSLILNNLNNHAPIKTKRVKHKRTPDWFTPDITRMQNLRDKCKRLKQWSDYKRNRNKTKQLIRQAKRNYFSNCINNSKDTRSIWKHLRNVNSGSNSDSSNLPEELVINDEHITDSVDIANKLNKYFASVAEILNDSNSNRNTSNLDFDKINCFIDKKVPKDIHFVISFITPEQVFMHLNKLDSTKATGLDGLGPIIIKLAAQALSPSIATLINKSIATGQFPAQLKHGNVNPIHKGGEKSNPSNYRPISILPTISKIIEKTS